MASTTVRLTVHEKEFEVTLTEKEGKVFAKTHVNNFGEVQVPDLGGGKDKALDGLKARVGNILAALESDEARETRRREAAQAAANPAPAPESAATAPPADPSNN